MKTSNISTKKSPVSIFQKSKRAIFSTSLNVFHLMLLGCLPLVYSCNGGMTQKTDDATEEFWAQDDNVVENTSLNKENTIDGKTLQFVQEEASDGMFEVQAGQLVQNKSDNRDIQNLANMIIMDHKNANEKLKDLARENNWNLPNEMMEKHREKLDKLQGLSAREFNQEYLSMMVNGHQKAIDKFEKQQKATDHQGLTKWINNTLPKLRNHLAKSKELKDKVVQQVGSRE